MHGPILSSAEARFLAACSAILLLSTAPLAAQTAPGAGSIPPLPEAQTLIRHVKPEQAKKLIDEKKVVVLDIRTPAEHAGGHIADAKNIDFNAPDFEKKIGELDRQKHYVVHCASGGRSTRSLNVFKKLKFRSIVHLDGGFNDWKSSGQPVAK